MILRKVIVENFRAFDRIEMDLDPITVLIGENNSGKTSFLDALRLCLGRTLNRRGTPFEDYDHRIPDGASQPGGGGPLSVTMDFAEAALGEWSPEVLQALPEAIVARDRLRHVLLKVTSQLDPATSEFVVDWEFLDAQGRGMGARSKGPGPIGQLQKLCPTFYLSALRDATREFSSRSSFWAPFLRDPSIADALRQELEKDLTDLNTRVIDAHEKLRDVRRTLCKAKDIVPLSNVNAVTIEALPGRLSDMLSRTQVNLTAPNGVSLPLLRHGAGTQSLSVLFLFEAFLASILADAYDPLSEPILALEEPEAHLHPSAVRCLWTILSTMKGQKLIATHSGDLLSEVPLTSVRRFCRAAGGPTVHRVMPGTLSPEDTRKLKFHVQASRGELFFARCWLLCEGETDYWILRRAAEIKSVDLEHEGVRIVTFATVGVTTFAKVANDLNILWHCLADGDGAGQNYRRSLLPYIGALSEADRFTMVPTDNIELLLCESGFGAPYAAHIAQQKRHIVTLAPGDAGYWREVLEARDRTPKEELALEAMDLAAAKGVGGIPACIGNAIDLAVRLARG